LNKKFNYYKHRISYLTGSCYNFEIEEFFSSFFASRGYASISWAFLSLFESYFTSVISLSSVTFLSRG